MFSPNRAGNARLRALSSLPAEFVFVAVDAEFVAVAVPEDEDEDVAAVPDLVTSNS